MHEKALTYSSYLALDDLLSAQHPRSEEHDELLFIVIHQVYELWFKQLIHEVSELQRRLDAGDGPHALHTLRRVRAILKTVVAQIDVLETMTPREFAGFRGRLESASGFQSAQFRELEKLLAKAVWPSTLRYLASRGYGPDQLLDAYRDEGEAAQVCEALVDVDEGLQEWRYRHVKMVERTIGDLPGTGGSSGVAYLRGTLFRPLYPDLWELRSRM